MLVKLTKSFKMKSQPKAFFENSDTNTFLNVDKVWCDWYNSYIDHGDVELYGRLSSGLFADNRKNFTDRLGKQDFCTLDSRCRRLHCWQIDLPNGILWILTAAERGTSYERLVTGDVDLMDEEIKEFFYTKLDIPRPPQPVTVGTEIAQLFGIGK
jgi:hypothetical protein